MFLYVKKKKKMYKVERKLQCVRATLSCGVLLLLLFFFFITFSAVPKNKMPIKMYSSRNERFITYGRLLPCFYCIFFFFVFLDYNVSFFFSKYNSIKKQKRCRRFRGCSVSSISRFTPTDRNRRTQSRLQRTFRLHIFDVIGNF